MRKTYKITLKGKIFLFFHWLFGKKMKNKNGYPCTNCKIGKDPKECTNKHCPDWREWFLQKWEEIHNWWEKHNDRT